jgi:hypothetical protein
VFTGLWLGGTKVKTSLGRHRHNLNLTEIGIDGVNWIQLARDRVKWWAFVNTVMNIRVP